MENPRGRDISPIKLTAALAVLVLAGAAVLQTMGSFDQKNIAETYVAPNDSSSGTQNAASPIFATEVDPISSLSDNAIGEVVGAYTGLQQTGTYSSTTGAQIAGTIGAGLQAPVSYTPITTVDVQTSDDTSYNAMMKYRSDLQTTLKPLLSNTQPEYVLFGEYVETKQQTYLDQLRAAAANYVASASSTEALTVPADAASVQVQLVNSLNEFAATITTLADHADDPIGSTVLLENYNQSESDVMSAFQALVAYEKSKTN